MLLASLVMSEWKSAGSSIIIFFVCKAYLLLPPSIEYAAKVHGAPTKPIRVALPSVSVLNACFYKKKKKKKSTESVQGSLHQV